MAQSNWTECSGVLSSGDLARGTTAGTTKPNGGGTYVWGANSLTVTTGTYARFTNQTNFAPIAKGADVSTALCRAPSGGLTGFSCWIFTELVGTAVTDNAYMLGLSDDDPSRIVLRKGAMSLGLPAGSPGSSGILARSTEGVDIGVWSQIRLETVVQPNSDVWINVYKSDLGAHVANSPSWVPIPGMAWSNPPPGAHAALAFIDDALAINTGSVPLTSGRAGWGVRTSDVSRRCLFKRVQIGRDLA